MTTATISSSRETTWPVGMAVSVVSGAALAVAGVWNALVQEHVTVDSPPAHLGPQVPPAEAMHTYYTWYATTVAQQRAATIAGMVGVAGLVILMAELRRRMAPAWGRGACTALQTGGVLWLVGSIAGVGGHRAVALMATHGNPIETVNVVAFTTDVTSDAFSAAGFLLVGLGLLALGASSYGGSRWRGLSLLTGVVALVVAYGYIAGIDSITTYELGVLAAVLTPVWLVWTGRLLDRTATP
jgi:hypothetical protein